MTKETPKCIIFDCDGTLVDSEDVTNRIIAEMAGELGITMSGAEATSIFGGKTIDEVLYKMRELSGNEVPDGWLERLIKNVSLAWKKELIPVEGAQDLLKSLSIPICVLNRIKSAFWICGVRLVSGSVISPMKKII